MEGVPPVVGLPLGGGSGTGLRPVELSVAQGATLVLRSPALGEEGCRASFTLIFQTGTSNPQPPVAYHDHSGGINKMILDPLSAVEAATCGRNPPYGGSLPIRIGTSGTPMFRYVPQAACPPVL